MAYRLAGDMRSIFSLFSRFVKLPEIYSLGISISHLRLSLLILKTTSILGLIKRQHIVDISVSYNVRVMCCNDINYDTTIV